MMAKITKWFRIYYNKITGSIAFIPALIAIVFLILSWIMLEIDFSEWGKEVKSNLSWLSLKDASTARSIVSTVAGALISLTVFSFSLVMIVLNQAASQMSNRVLASMIENRFQQIILGFYIGTIVYALFLLSTVRDINSGIYVPALSIYLLILLTVIDIFLFIYFLDYVTQTVKYETVISRVQEQTLRTMKQKYKKIEEQIFSLPDFEALDFKTPESNYFQGFNHKKLLQIASEKDMVIRFLYPQATYLIKGIVFMEIYSMSTIDKECREEIMASSDFFKGQPIQTNADYGFNQIAEVAIKALSPGINDPGTAVICLHALADLLAFRLDHQLPLTLFDDKGKARIFIPTTNFDEVFKKCIYPIWNYGKKDEYIQEQLLQMMQQLKVADHLNKYTELFGQLINEIEREMRSVRE